MNTLKPIIPIAIAGVFLLCACNRLTLTIESDPEGADVSIDGKPVGKTPWTGEWERKKTDITLRSPEWEPLVITGIDFADIPGSFGKSGKYESLENGSFRLRFFLYTGNLKNDIARAITLQDAPKLLSLFDHQSMTDTMRADILSRLIDEASTETIAALIAWVKSDSARLSLRHRFFRIAYEKEFRSGYESLFPLPDDVNALLPDGSTPLIDAVKHDNPALVEYLLKAGAQTSVGDKNGKSPVQWAIDLKLFRPLFALRDNGVAVFDYRGQNSGDAVILANYNLKYAASRLSKYPDATHSSELNSVYRQVTNLIAFDSLYADVRRMYYYAKGRYYAAQNNDASAISYLTEAVKYVKSNVNGLYFYGHLMNIDLFSWELDEPDDAPADAIMLELAKANNRKKYYQVATYWSTLFIRLRPDLYEWVQTTADLAPLNRENQTFLKMIEDENPAFQ